MNVLNAVGSLDQRMGGPLRAVLDLSANATAFGLKSDVVGYGPIHIPDNPLDSQSMHCFPPETVGSYLSSPEVDSWCRDNLKRFDGVVLHGLWSPTNWTISRQCLRAGLPYIVFPHGMLDLWSVHGQGFLKKSKKTFYWHWRERRELGESSAVFFTLERELQNTRKTFDLPEIRTAIVSPFGVSPQSTAEQDLKPSARVDQGATNKVALFLGRVHPKKRPDLLIEAWAKANVPRDWRLVIAGPGEAEYLETLSRLTKTLGIEDAVQFVGSVSGADKWYLFRRSQWFLLSSEQENFGIAVLEAMNSGCALAISDQVYLADEFPAGSEILPVSLEPWVVFMKERMIDDAWRNQMVTRVRDHIGDKFNMEHVSQQWVQQLENVFIKGSQNRT